MRRTGIWFLSVFIIVPLYALAAWLLVRSGALSETAGLTDAQFKAVAAFVGTTLAASVTLIGLLLTDAHNEKARKQSALDTAVKGIALISDPGHDYAPKAAVGGALAALVDLDQRVIAMRTLDAAWDDAAVHASTASWLVGEVIKKNADVQGVLEASEVLRNNADRLVGPDDKRGRHFWPQSLLHEWPNKLPVAARMDLLVAISRLLLSRNKDWWGEDVGHFLLLLRGALDDGNKLIEFTAAAMLQLLAVALDDKTPLRDRKGQETMLNEILDEAWKVDHGTVIGEISNSWHELDGWVRGEYPGVPAGSA